jgi:hypothetical protein
VASQGGGAEKGRSGPSWRAGAVVPSRGGRGRAGAVRAELASRGGGAELVLWCGGVAARPLKVARRWHGLSVVARRRRDLELVREERVWAG